MIPILAEGSGWFTPDMVYIILVIIAGIITLIVEWKRRGAKSALIGMMKTIQKHKENGSDEELKEAAEMIADAIKTDWSKESKTSAIRKTGELIDKVYDAEVKKVKDLQDALENDMKEAEAEKEK